VFFQTDSNLALTYVIPHLGGSPRSLRGFLCDLCVLLLPHLAAQLQKDNE